MQWFTVLMNIFFNSNKERDVRVPIRPTGTIGMSEASSILLDKLEEMGDGTAEIFLPDKDIKVYKKEDVSKAYELAEVSSIVYITEEHDCDDFAAKLYGKFAGLVWTNVHALNWFIDEGNNFWFIEPQTGEMSKSLDRWQGYTVRFFVGR